MYQNPVALLGCLNGKCVFSVTRQNNAHMHHGSLNLAAGGGHSVVLESLRQKRHGCEVQIQIRSPDLIWVAIFHFGLDFEVEKNVLQLLPTSERYCVPRSTSTTYWVSTGTEPDS